jgi:hypothetical protein
MRDLALEVKRRFNVSNAAKHLNQKKKGNRGISNLKKATLKNQKRITVS